MLRSEWLKLVTVRSTFWTTAIALLLAGSHRAAVRLPVQPGIRGAGDRRAGRLRPSASASSRWSSVCSACCHRRRVRDAADPLLVHRGARRAGPPWSPKPVVVAAWSFVLGLVVTFGSFGLIAVLFGGKGMAVPFDGDTVGALVGGAVYLAMSAPSRRPRRSRARLGRRDHHAVAALLFVAPIIVALIAAAAPARSGRTTADHYLLSSRGSVLFARPGTAAIELWAAIVALACWVAAVWVPALVLTSGP